MCLDTVKRRIFTLALVAGFCSVRCRGSKAFVGVVCPFPVPLSSPRQVDFARRSRKRPDPHRRRRGSANLGIYRPPEHVDGAVFERKAHSPNRDSHRRDQSLTSSKAISTAITKAS